MELIALLILFNFLLFLVPYFTNFREEPNPFGFFKKNKSKRELIRNFDWKISSDPFRIFYEYSFIIILFSTFNLNEIWFIIPCVVVGSFSFSYLIYISVMQYVFKKSPAIMSDVILAKAGLLIMRKYKMLIYLGIIVLILGIVTLFFYVSKYLLSLPNPHWAVSIISLSLITWMAFRVLKYFGYKFLIAKNVFLVSFHFYKNMRLSLKYRNLIKKDKSYFEKYNQYDHLQFTTELPNIKIVSFESYGSIVFKNEDFRKEVVAFYNNNIRERLKANNLKIASSLSTAPAFGGGSWLCYSSIFYGIKFDEQDLYEILFSNKNAFLAYNGLFDILKQHGFKTYNTSGLSYSKKDPVDWGKIKRNIRHDKMFDIKDFNYNGQFMHFLKTRTCLPDQYTLNITQELISNENPDKQALFFSNLNSHVPYDSPIKAVDDWKEIPKLEYETNSSESNLSIKYIQSINYQLDYLFDYINKQDDDAIYVLFGDHQPPFIAKEVDGMETPMHIIYKNNDFIQPFLEHGFVEGFIPQNKEISSINHEGFLSIFMQALNKAYGKNKDLELAYFPDGQKII